MNSTKTIFLSKKGMKELKKAIQRLERERQTILTRLREIDKVDTRDERFARIEQISALENTESELADKRLLLSQAKLFPRKRDALKVAIGSVVDLLDTNGRIIRYTLVESLEANPSDGRISIKSPLGRSLLGKQIKDTVEWSAGITTKRLQLIGIA